MAFKLISHRESFFPRRHEAMGGTVHTSIYHLNLFPHALPLEVRLLCLGCRRVCAAIQLERIAPPPCFFSFSQ